MFSRLLFLTFTILSLFHRLQVEAAINYFLNPPYTGAGQNFTRDVTFTLGSTIDLKWVTSYSTVSLTIWQQNLEEAAASAFELFANQDQLTTFQWTVDFSGTGWSLDDSNVFYFELYNGDAFSDTSFTSHYFNVSSNGPKTTQSIVTASIPPASSGAETLVQTVTIDPQLTYHAPLASSDVTKTTITSGSAAKHTTHHHHSSTPTQTNTNSGLSSGTKIGIGVGVGVGVGCLLIGAAVGFLFFRRRAQKTAPKTPDNGDYQRPWDAPPPHAEQAGYNQGHNSVAEKRVGTEFQPGELPTHERPQQLDTGAERHELPGSRDI